MKCIVKNCINQTHEGQFIGELCSPCHEFVTTGNGVYSQAYRNTQRPWVGLEEEEIKHAPHHMVDGAYHYSFKQGAQWAEAKLREKNGGQA